jgi:hypothetical protein
MEFDGKSHFSSTLEWAVSYECQAHTRSPLGATGQGHRQDCRQPAAQHFLTEAAEKELMRRRQIAALKGAAGAWKDSDHPELKQGSDQWVRKLRREGERRLKK